MCERHDNIYRMHWGGAQTTLGGQVMLMVHDIGTDSVNEQFFVTVYFKLEKTFSSHFKWTLVPRLTWSSIKMLIKSRKDETNTWQYDWNVKM